MIKTENLDKNLTEIKEKIYDQCSFQISEMTLDPESKEYSGRRFKLNEHWIICRNSKLTPKKIGQFVTFWRRNKKGQTEPYREMDQIDFYIINTRTEKHFGQFVFPKSVLIDKGLISTDKKDGKRGFRVYPPWDRVESELASRTQKWQLDYFLNFDESLDLGTVKKMYRKK